MTKKQSLPKATLFETLRILNDVFIPNIAKGVIIRRPQVIAMVEKLNLDKRNNTLLAKTS